MKTLLALGLLVGAGSAAASATELTAPRTLQSVSGQFVVFDRPVAPARPWLFGEPASTNQLELAPSFLLVACERIKQAVYEELEAGRDWQGTIYVTLRPDEFRPGIPQIRGERLGWSWKYRVDLPARLAPDQFVRTIVQVVLLEMANRSATERSVEIPLWLSEGLTQQLMGARAEEILLSRPELELRSVAITPLEKVKRNPDPLKTARATLEKYPATSFDELSWPTPQTFTPEQSRVFQASAQVFVSELLDLPQGPGLMRSFIVSLPRYLNWQLAFLDAYAGKFSNQLAVTKWWALQAEYFTSRDQNNLWTVAESAAQLDSLLHATVAVRGGADELPERRQVTLQAALREWDTVRQIELIREKLHTLELARQRVAPAFLTLVSEYHGVLKEHLKQQLRSTTIFPGILITPPHLRDLVAATCRQLDVLDARRAAVANSVAEPDPVAVVPDRSE